MLSNLSRAFERLPKPLIPLLPISFGFLGPGLLLWLVAFHIPVPYPQETMAPYADSSPATMELGHQQAAPAEMAATKPEVRSPRRKPWTQPASPTRI